MQEIKQRNLTCPVCGGNMETVMRYEVEIDICTKCKGVWLDRGELNKIVSAVSEIYDNLHNVLPDDSAYIFKKEINSNQDTLVDRYEDANDRNFLKKIFEIDNI